MLAKFAFRVAAFSQRFAIPMVAVSVIATVLCGLHVAKHLGITTDTSAIISPELSWRQNEREMERYFPQRSELILIVVDGKTPELAEYAAAALTERLREQKDLFQAVRRPEGGDYFRRNGLLFLPTAELRALADQIIAAQPLIGGLAIDPSMRGLFTVLTDVFRGVEEGEIDGANLVAPLTTIARATEVALEGREEPVSWQTLITGREPNARELRRFVMAQPNRNFTKLAPGAASIAAVRAATEDLKLTPEHGIQVRLTGSVPIADEEFTTVEEGTDLSLKLSSGLVLILLILALRSWRVIIPILITLVCGLVVTAEFATLAIGRLNVISVSFAVLFVGIGVDFGIQFAVRYRQERFERNDLGAALRAAGQGISGAMLLAAIATAAGFFSFIPTDFRGVSELGLISGAGMIIAGVLNLTLLPALLSLFQPKGEPEAVGYAWAKPVDNWMARRKYFVLGLAGGLAIFCLALLPRLNFDMNPLNLKDQRTEAVSLLRDLMANPNTTPYTIAILTPSIDAAVEMAGRLSGVKEVARVITAKSFVPQQQEVKLAIIADMKDLLGLTLTPLSVAAPPRPEDIAMAAYKLRERISAALPKASREAQAVARTLDRAVLRYVEAPAAARARADQAVLGGLLPQLDSLKLALTAAPVTLDSLPDELKEFWISKDGHARVEVFPSGDSRNNTILVEFVAAVRAVADTKITGTPVTIYESARTVVSAFSIAGLLALASITIILGATLRRVLDVILVMAPLLLAVLMTLGTTVLVGLDLNYANVIALPLLLGIGVAYSIYFVMAWRSGQTVYLQSGTARAILFSALTTGSAFGTLAISSHEGTAGMGLLLTISLICMLFATFFVQPAMLAWVGPRKSQPKNILSKVRE